MTMTAWWWTVWVFYVRCNPEIDVSHRLEQAKLGYHAAVLLDSIEPRYSSSDGWVRFTTERFSYFRDMEESRGD